MKKLTLNKSIISTLAPDEASKIMGGATQVYEGCAPGSTWDNCSDACSNYCGGTYPCPSVPCNPTYGGCNGTWNGCQSDYGCPQDTVPYTQCGTVC